MMERLECERMFVAVMETGSFTLAATRLGTSSGQASKLVSRLEADLGVRLLNRTTRSVSPTEVGQAYFERIKLLIDDDSADRAMIVCRTFDLLAPQLLLAEMRKG